MAGSSNTEGQLGVRQELIWLRTATHAALTSREREVGSDPNNSDTEEAMMRRQHMAMVRAVRTVDASNRLSDAARSLVDLWMRSKNGDDVSTQLESHMRELHSARDRYELTLSEG